MKIFTTAFFFSFKRKWIFPSLQGQPILPVLLSLPLQKNQFPLLKPSKFKGYYDCNCRHGGTGPHLSVVPTNCHPNGPTGPAKQYFVVILFEITTQMDSLASISLYPICFPISFLFLLLVNQKVGDVVAVVLLENIMHTSDIFLQFLLFQENKS